MNDEIYADKEGGKSFEKLILVAGGTLFVLYLLLLISPHRIFYAGFLMNLIPFVALFVAYVDASAVKKLIGRSKTTYGRITEAICGKSAFVNTDIGLFYNVEIDGYRCKYKVNDEEFENITKIDDGNVYKEGDTIKIFYSRKDPRSAITCIERNSTLLGAFVFLLSMVTFTPKLLCDAYCAIDKIFVI